MGMVSLLGGTGGSAVRTCDLPSTDVAALGLPGESCAPRLGKGGPKVPEDSVNGLPFRCNEFERSLAGRTGGSTDVLEGTRTDPAVGPP